jgi:murein DD-endopeptidase MepM/ murein hydrolase activator NlpD
MKRRSILWSVVLFSGLLIASLFFSQSQQLDPITQHLPLPKTLTSIEPSKAVKESTPSLSYKTYRIPKNGSLSTALDAMNQPAVLALEIAKLPNSQWLTHLRAGDTLKFGFDKQGQLKEIQYPKSQTLTYVLQIDEDALHLHKQIKVVERHVVRTGGTIKSSFYLSGKKAGLSDRSIMNLADIYSWDIDFIRQLREGDPFKVIYEQKYLNGKYIGDGDILAALITTYDGTKHYAFLLKDKDGKKLGYFDEKGHNLRKAFLRNPVDYVRITSRFQPRRYHPVLHKWRAHRGVDYAGPIGTPIHVTGDGQIIKRAWSHSYGRVIFVKHAGKYTTVYGHMSKFGKYKKGDWVKQGDIIGYIGMTGLASGPHLHYEFRINGKHVDPLKVRFPDAAPVPKKYRAEYKKYVALMKDQLKRTPTKVQSWMKNFE